MSEELDLADLLAVRKLKKLLRRSLSSPTWRDSDRLVRVLRRAYLQWADASPLEVWRATAEAAAREHRRRMSRRDDDAAEVVWLQLRHAIDELLAAADELAGHKIRSNR